MRYFHVADGGGCAQLTLWIDACLEKVSFESSFQRPVFSTYISPKHEYCMRIAKYFEYAQAHAVINGWLTVLFCLGRLRLERR